MGHSEPVPLRNARRGAHFTGRTEELDALTSRMANGINVVTLSPRRYGKTSLHRTAQVRLAESKPAPALVEVNVVEGDEPGGAGGMLTAAAYRVPGARWLRRVRVTPAVSFDTTGPPRFGFDTDLSRPDAEAVITDVYALG